MELISSEPKEEVDLWLVQGWEWAVRLVGPRIVVKLPGGNTLINKILKYIEEGFKVRNPGIRNASLVRVK